MIKLSEENKQRWELFKIWLVGLCFKFQRFMDWLMLAPINYKDGENKND